MTSRAFINPLAKNSGVSLRATIQNPRPRKYASDADRQKAFRERQAVIQVRVAPKAVETFDEIAETLGYSRQEVVYALLMKGLMSLGNWETVGLPIDWQKKMPQFKLPRYEENPTMRKATPAQLAARERFAEMARSGAFKRKAKKNPAKKTVSQKISQLVREGYPQKQAVAIALSEESKGKVRKNPLGVSGGRYEIVWARSGDLKGSYDDLGQAKDLLDDIDRPTGLFYGIDTKTGKRFYSFAAETKMLGKIKRNPAEAKERKPRVVLITNPKQRMLNISWLTAGGQREIMKVPIDFVFTHYVGNVAERFFARTENGQLIVSEYSTGGKIGQVPFTMRSAALNDRAAAKRYVVEMLSRIGAERFKAAVKKFEPIN